MISRKLVVQFTRGAQRFEVFRELTADGIVYVGFRNGERSATAQQGFLVVRALLTTDIGEFPRGV